MGRIIGSAALLMVLLVMSACGGTDTASPPSPAPSPDRSADGGVTQAGLSGVSFEVHRDPG